MFQGSSSVSSRRSDLAFVFDLWSFPKDVLGPTMDRGSYFAIDYHPKDNPKARSWLILVPLTSCQITAAEAFPWCQLDMGRVQLFAILPSRDSRNIIGILSIMWRVEYIAAIRGCSYIT